MMKLGKCELCQSESPLDELTHVHNLGKITYECWDDKKCREIAQERKRQIKLENDKILRIIKEKENQEQEAFSEERKKFVIKETKLWDQFNIMLENLWEYHQKNNNGYIHYYDSENNIVYSWDINKEIWGIADSDTTRYVIDKMTQE